MPERVVKGCVHCGRRHGWHAPPSSIDDEVTHEVPDQFDPETGEITDKVSSNEEKEVQQKQKGDLFVQPPPHSQWVLIDLDAAVAEHLKKQKVEAEAKKAAAKMRVKKLWRAVQTVVKVGNSVQSSRTEQAGEPHGDGKENRSFNLDAEYRT